MHCCSVRPLTPDDAPAFVTLRREALSDSPWAFAASEGDDMGLDAAHMARSLAEPGRAVVGAFAPDGRLVGIAGVVTNRHRKMAHRAQVWGVYVTPAFRGSGVGQAIMAGVQNVARAWPGVTSLGLSVSMNSPHARRVYERAGFVAWGTEPGAIVCNGAAYDEVHMVAPVQR
jgi:RimJ/RimL family protein N-acetyltransferase